MWAFNGGLANLPLMLGHGWNIAFHKRMWMHYHYNDVIMGATASQITSLTIVYSAVYSGANQRKHQRSTSLAFVPGIHRWPVNSPHKWPVTRKMFPFEWELVLSTVTNSKSVLGSIRDLFSALYFLSLSLRLYLEILGWGWPGSCSLQTISWSLLLLLTNVLNVSRRGRRDWNPRVFM